MQYAEKQFILPLDKAHKHMEYHDDIYTTQNSKQVLRHRLGWLKKSKAKIVNQHYVGVS